MKTVRTNEQTWKGWRDGYPAEAAPVETSQMPEEKMTWVALTAKKAADCAGCGKPQLGLRIAWQSKLKKVYCVRCADVRGIVRQTPRRKPRKR